MQQEPTALRMEDPGIRDLFSDNQRLQSWLDVEAALAQAEAELDIVPADAAEEITRKCRLEYLDRDAIQEGLARTGHGLVPLIWELDRVCDGDAGGIRSLGSDDPEHHADWQAAPATQGAPHLSFAVSTDSHAVRRPGRRNQGLRASRKNSRPARRPRDVRAEGGGVDRRTRQAYRASQGMREQGVRGDAGWRRRNAGIARANRTSKSRRRWLRSWTCARCRCRLARPPTTWASTS